MIKISRSAIISVSCILLASSIAVRDYYQSHQKIVIEHEDKEIVVSEKKADNAVAVAMIAEPAEKQVTHVVAKGETILSILLTLGMDREHASHAIKELKNVYNPKAFKQGQEIHFTYKPGTESEPARIIALGFKTTAGHDISLKYDDDKFTAQKFEIKLTKVLRKVEGSINSSFYSAALKKGVPAPLVKEAIAALSYDINWQHDPKSGDEFKILFEVYEDEDGNIIKFGELKFAAFAPKGNWRQIYSFKTPNGSGYYNAKGESVVKSLLATPVDSTKMRVTSRFGNRHHPCLGYTKMHKGIDFGAPSGTPVSSAGDGVVIKAGWYGSYGNYVLVRHNNEYSTAYAHLSKVHVKAGQHVRQRQSLGAVGSTGRTSGPHLHYEVIYRGQQVNPQSIKQMPSVKLNAKDMARFQEAKSQCDVDLQNAVAITELAVAKPVMVG